MGEQEYIGSDWDKSNNKWYPCIPYHKRVVKLCETNKVIHVTQYNNNK